MSGSVDERTRPAFFVPVETRELKTKRDIIVLKAFTPSRLPEKWLSQLPRACKEAAEHRATRRLIRQLAGNVSAKTRFSSIQDTN